MMRAPMFYLACLPSSFLVKSSLGVEVRDDGQNAVKHKGGSEHSSDEADHSVSLCKEGGGGLRLCQGGLR